MTAIAPDVSSYRGAAASQSLAENGHKIHLGGRWPIFLSFVTRVVAGSLPFRGTVPVVYSQIKRLMIRI
jgi:hypothetical protein